MLDSDMSAQLQNYMGLLRRPFTINASLGDDAKSGEMRDLLQQIAGMSDKITLQLDGNDARKPSFALTRADAEQHLRFATIPLGHEFTSLVLALLWTGGHPPKVSDALIAQIKALPGEYNFEVYISLSCHNCPDVVQALTLMAVFNPRVKVAIIDGALYQSEVDSRQVMAVPTLYLNGQMLANGRMTAEDILGKIDSAAASRQADALATKAPYDVLVLGGGPAGSAAAIYAARKGIRTGMVAERMGGQIMDTLSIENLIAIKETEGPKLGAAFEENVTHYGVDLIQRQRATALTPAPALGGLAQVQLESGATLQAKNVIIATGASWREMGIPGEAQYKTRGIAFCPHCDGPVFKGKQVAVVGGGNSGVEAAIDLAGVAEHVTLFEYAAEMRADAVLQAKLRELPNVTILTQVQTTEVVGDGQRVTALRYQDRTTGQAHELALSGIFVQIGLRPNTAWLQDTLELSKSGEIVVDAKCHTSVPGVFAAGDCSSVPYKQIVIAIGEGAKAALSAFDHLVRNR